MKSVAMLVAKFAAATCSLALLSALPSNAQCADRGIWTPEPVQQVEAGTPQAPAFHAVYGLSCGGTVYMVRFGNQIGPHNQIVSDVIGQTKVACNGGVWTPTPIQKAQSGNPSNLAFHTVYGLSCGGSVYMIRFSNVIAPGNRIIVDVIGKAATP
jgi:hypothetical protein